jgi:hypothetical protein
MTIGDYFLNNCCRLVSATFAFPSLKSTGSNFMNECKSLSSVNFTCESPYLMTLELSFMRECTSLVAIDLSSFSSLTKISNRSFQKCDSLKNLILPGTTVGLDDHPLKDVMNVKQSHFL